MRIEGYYWVKYGVEWIIAEWYELHDQFQWKYNWQTLHDIDFEEIDERRIIRNQVFHAPIEIELTSDPIKFGLFGNPQDHEPEKYD